MESTWPVAPLLSRSLPVAFSLVLIRAIGLGAAPATAVPKPPLSELLAPICQKYELPGMAGCILAEGKVMDLGVTGVRKKGRPESLGGGDLFHLGSCTKSMTATIIAQLVEEGKLGWSSTPGEIFSDLGSAARPAWRSVTLEQLLRHRGGAPDDQKFAWRWSLLRVPIGTVVRQRERLVSWVLADEPAHLPGTTFSYSNAGYVLAGAMAERATGRSWEHLIRDRLFRPLGMTTAGFGAPRKRDVIDEPRGHTAAGYAIEPESVFSDNPAALGPAGTVHASLRDWAKYVALHLAGARGEKTPLLRPASFARLHEPVGEGEHGYAMGWGVVERPWGGGRVLVHSGSNTLWFVTTWLAPRKNFAVLVACNQGGRKAAQACDAAARALIRRWGGR